MELTTKSSQRTLLGSIRAIAQEGLSYSQSPYDIARYEKLLGLASAQYAEITGLPQEDIREMFLKEYGSITPKLGIDTAVMNSNGSILVLKRGDGTWCLPCGWADVGESPFQTARRETLEETGLAVVPIGYIAITHKTPETHPGFASQVNICVAVEPVSSQVVALSHEHTEYKWITGVEQVDNWHAGHARLIPGAFAAYQQRLFIPNVD